MEKFDATFLASIQKANGLDIHERHGFEIQRDGRLLTFDPLLQFLEMIGLQPTT